MAQKITAIGWDVGGWMGARHGAAVCTIDHEGITWAKEPAVCSLPEDGFWNPEDLARQGGFEAEFPEDSTVVVGIDAPLSFPEAFTRFLAGDTVPAGKPGREIDNPLAYRETDRYIHKKYRKKPLSASFDRIGNNATVAMSHVKKWETDYGFHTRPFSCVKSSREIIEVYPALVKQTSKSPAAPFLHKWIPETAAPGTDAYDACICALYAAAFALNGSLLPALEGPPVEGPWQKEGWIYHFDRDL
ncbi:DUF429 domain-containing protein [Alteribacter lacisalsi]|uniref:DUF429 domain-containing protein n=1 Tax=Alteribacter lacisalsi TaxID=2045244 RepID=A0A2W0HAQ5_9BACI|nr:DUF429 domain-containing protein [Alteribacter lacisalsi]PYZ98247.1 DUF429 domain-containing protein [Alteribacter lacisalsi]